MESSGESRSRAAVGGKRRSSGGADVVSSLGGSARHPAVSPATHRHAAGAARGAARGFAGLAGAPGPRRPR
ncbi:hypothetical protein EJB05_01420, partial [Eragrostis curvula]